MSYMRKIKRAWSTGHSKKKSFLTQQELKDILKRGLNSPSTDAKWNLFMTLCVG